MRCKDTYTNKREGDKEYRERERETQPLTSKIVNLQQLLLAVSM